MKEGAYPLKLILKKCIISLVFACCLILTGCNVETNNTIISELQSSDERYTAVKFERDMGATTRKSIQLSILPKGYKLGNDTGNAYVSYDDFEFSWIEEDVLEIIKKKNSDSFKAENKLYDVDIVYKEQ